MNWFKLLILNISMKIIYELSLIIMKNKDIKKYS